jgi:pseudouridine-5'-phosphate glycosidase
MIKNNYLEINEEVKTALYERRPLVALESTIISFGMPYPKNVETAKSVETLIRNTGATPACIAIMDGKIKIGLSDDDLLRLAEHKDDIMKCSARDISYAVSRKRTGATTVAGTMIGAEMAGIKIFATGGIGGVHRGAELSMDISADLQEMSRTKVAVVCAGVKSILDIGRTLEYLETLGVPVIGYRTHEFPAFYSRYSGFSTDFKIDTPKFLAQYAFNHWEMGLKSGLLIANPIPENHGLDKEMAEKSIQIALDEARENKVKGKALTPFLLARIKEITGGLSLESNIALVHNNALLGTQLAIELNKLEIQEYDNFF